MRRLSLQNSASMIGLVWKPGYSSEMVLHSYTLILSTAPLLHCFHHRDHHNHQNHSHSPILKFIKTRLSVFRWKVRTKRRTNGHEPSPFSYYTPYKKAQYMTNFLSGFFEIISKLTYVYFYRPKYVYIFLSNSPDFRNGIAFWQFQGFVSLFFC